MNFSRIIIEDLPKEVQKWASVLVLPLNSMITTLKTVLSKGLTINEHFRGAIQAVSITANTATFNYAGKTTPKVIIVGNFQDRTDPSWTPTGGISNTFTYNGSQIKITFYGLTFTHSYYATLLILED
jgi:hypothetical protein